MKKNRMIKALIILVVAVLLAVGLEILQIATQPKQYENEIRVIREAGTIDLEKFDMENAELKSGALQIDSEGGSITVDLGKPEKFELLQIWARKHLKKDVNLKVYFAGSGEDFTEERSVSLLADKSLMAWEPPIPVGEYQKLRIISDGKISIDKILYSEGLEERVAKQEALHPKRIILVSIILFLVIMFLVHERVLKRAADVLHRAVEGIMESYSRTIVHVLLFAITGIGGYFLSKVLWAGGVTAELNWPKQLFCLAVGLVVASLLTFRRTLGKKPEVIFAIISLCAGCLMVFLFPDMREVSWDDGYHYDQALTWSYFGDKRLTEQDLMNIKDEMFTSDLHYFEPNEREALHEKQQKRYEEGVSYIQPTPLESKNAYEIFAGTGLFLGRVLGLSYYWYYCVGKFFNLLTYTTCGFFAIRRMKSGKMVLSLILMIPTAMFLASAYSYDPGLMAFATLGLAYCFAEWQETDRRMTREHAITMVGSLLIGCLTKAIYFPLLLIPMMLPESKFRKRDEPAKADGISRRAFLLLCVGAIMVLLATFMIPTLAGEVNGDERGGDNISVYGQISGILEDPFRYASILLTFLGSFLAPRNASVLLTSFAYMGMGSWGMQYFYLLIAAAFTDKEQTDRVLAHNLWSRVVAFIAVFGTIVLISTSMYIMITNVGADTFYGVQHRYLLPLVFPFLMILGSELISRPLKLEIPWRRIVYNGFTFALGAFILFSGIWETCVSLYVG